jgi:hypothetical protein
LVATELKCFECKGGGQKVEHVFVVLIEAQHVRIHVKDFNGDISMRAGVLERPRAKIQGKIVSVKSQAHGRGETGESGCAITLSTAGGLVEDGV